MSTNYVCDYCGEPIPDGEGGSLHAFGGLRGPRLAWTTQDYHASHERDCLGAMARVIAVATEVNTAAVREAIDRIDRFGAPQRHDPIREIHERRARWEDWGKVGQERFVLEVIGERRLTKREIVEALQARLGDEFHIYDNYVQNVLRHLLAAGEVVRAPEDWRGRYRYRYARTPLSGPITELERAFDEQGEASA